MSETANQKPRSPSRSKRILIWIRSRVIGDSRLRDGRGEGGSRYVFTCRSGQRIAAWLKEVSPEERVTEPHEPELGKKEQGGVQASRGAATIGQPCKYRHPRSSKKQLLINTANHDSPPKVIPRPPSPEQSRPSCTLPSFPIHFLLRSLSAQSMTRPARSQSPPPSIVCG
jgi:hypothetical protein